MTNSTPSIASTCLELLDEGVLRFGQHANQHVAVELLHGTHDRQATDELGYETELDEVFGKA